MSQKQQEYTIRTEVDAALWEAIVDAVNTIGSKQEAAFEFGEEELRIRVKDAANVAMVAQDVDVTGFDTYTVGGTGAVIGLNTAKFGDLLDVAKGSDTVSFNLNAETRKFEFEANGVEYELAGIDPESMTGTPTDVPPVKDEHDYTIRCRLPVEKWSTGIDVVDLAGSGHGTFAYRPTPGTFALEGHGDTDTSRVALTDHDAFAWVDGSPESTVECVMSNEYMSEVIDIIEAGDDDAVRFVTGTELPFHVWQTHADGRIETKVLQAPRIVSE
jgi:proliferating cell nuclear antigen